MRLRITEPLKHDGTRYAPGDVDEFGTAARQLIANGLAEKAPAKKAPAKKAPAKKEAPA